MCRFFKYFMRLDRDAFLQLLQRTVTLILEGYAATTMNSYVYLGGVIIGEYGYYNSCQELVTRILKVFCDTTLPVLEKGPDAYDRNPNLVEDFTTSVAAPSRTRRRSSSATTPSCSTSPRQRCAASSCSTARRTTA